MKDLVKQIVPQLVTLLLGFAVFAAYERFTRPAPPVVLPDRIEIAAKAYMDAQPAVLESLAAGSETGQITKENLAEKLREARLPVSKEIADAIMASPSLSTALRAAAKAEKSRLR